MRSEGTPSVRRHNLASALRLVADSQADGQALSRAGIAERAGLTKATAGSLVDELLGARLLRELREELPAGGRVGRPATGLRLDGAGALSLGLEVNVDYLAVSVVDLAGAVLHSRVVVEDSRARPPVETLRRVAGMATEAVTAVTASTSGMSVTSGGATRLAGAVLAVPGLVDAHAGAVRVAPNLGWKDVPVAARLRRWKVFRDVTLEVVNEADAAAVAEAARRGPTGGDFVRISGEVGVGAGIMLGGTLLRGARGWGGELGHLTVEPDGPACPCGSRGCLEQYAGQEAVLRAAGIDIPTVTALAAPVASSVDTLTARAADGDAAVLRSLERAGSALGLVVAGVLNLLDVEVVILGGSHALLAPWLLPPLRAELARRVVWGRWAPPTVVTSRLGPEAAVLGAAETVRRRVLADPAAWMDAAPA